MDGNGEIMESIQQMRPLLHTACLLGDEESVKRLISNQIDLNQLDYAGCTCTQLAAAAGYLNVVKILVANGANVENKDASHGNTALHEASWRGYSNLVKFLSNPNTVNIQNNGGFTPLHLSCQAGHNQSTRELLLGGGNPNLVNTYGDTALHTSVRYGHAGVTRILLSARALTDVQNKNGDTSLHISSAMGRKKITKILLSAGCLPNVQNNQSETPLDISLRKGFTEVTEVIKNPPFVMSPLERDEMRASRYKAPLASQNQPPSLLPLHRKKESRSQDAVSAQALARSTPTSKNGSKSKSTSSVNLKTTTAHSHTESGKKTGSTKNAKEEVPKWSPYGCHNQPNTAAFPPPNIDSLPTEPLTTGELYYLDLAGNIHKGPMGVSEGCYCGPLLNQTNSQSLVALDKLPPVHHGDKDPHRRKINIKNKDKHQIRDAEDLPHSSLRPPLRETTSKYEDHLKSLTHQLSKIHLDTQAQLSSLHSMLNERLKDTTESHHQEPSFDENESKLKEWVRQYRRFRKELSKNPKTLQQANELLSSASTLLSTRIVSPAPPDSGSDSGI